MFDFSNPNKLFRLWKMMFGDKYPDNKISELDIQINLDQVVGFYEVTEKIKVSKEDYDNTLRALCADMLITGMVKGTPVVRGNSFGPWVLSRDDIIDFYWDRFRTYMIENKNWNSDIVDKLGAVNSDILDLIRNPLDEGPWSIKGLVMGDVQSGKTANYTALCNKAIDAGYRVIIVLAGSQENLRQQTQRRLDKEVVGFDSQELLEKVAQKTPIGVGEINSNGCITTFTSRNYDFDKKIQSSVGLRLKDLNGPALFVVKKQKDRLAYLTRWLKKNNGNAEGLIDEPMLLIDDEADNYSINTRDGDVTTINKSIRRLLASFTRKSYVGYTATPYANIFIDPDTDDEMLKNDLFPEDFIYPLNAPSNYIGTTAIFGDEPTFESMLEDIDDAEDCIPIKHKTVDDITGIPITLYEAIRYFMIVNAIMDAEGIKKNHRTLLINVSRITNIHEYLLCLIKVWIDKLKDEVLGYSALSPNEAVIASLSIRDLKHTWEVFNLSKTTKFDWESIQTKFLYNAIKDIDVVQVNQKTRAESLDYDIHKENGWRVITIGGNSLSRGLTLEGLCVSYFYRNSKMYDTLLQMGRWFGYRDGYSQLCKIWMSDEAQESYEHITMATTELREELQYMSINNMSPKEFGLMIRSRPEVIDIIERERIKKRMKYQLTVTAKNKMKTAAEIVMSVSIRGDLIETPKIPVQIQTIAHNFNLLNNFLKSLEAYKNKDTNLFGGEDRLWTDVPVNQISNLLRKYISGPIAAKAELKTIADFIEQVNEFSFWDVAVPTGSSEYVLEDMESYLGEDFKLERRFTDIDSTKEFIRINGSKQRVGSKPCTKYGLTKSKILIIENQKKIGDKGVSDKDFLIPSRKPILLFHFIEMHSEKVSLKTPTNKDLESKIVVANLNEKLQEQRACLTAIGIGIPHDISGASTEYVRYIINVKKQQELEDEIKEQGSYDD